MKRNEHKALFSRFGFLGLDLTFALSYTLLTSLQCTTLFGQVQSTSHTRFHFQNEVLCHCCCLCLGLGCLCPLHRSGGLHQWSVHVLHLFEPQCTHSDSGVDQGSGVNTYIRSPPNNSPVKDLSSSAVACNANNRAVPKTLEVSAGDVITFECK